MRDLYLNLSLFEVGSIFETATETEICFETKSESIFLLSLVLKMLFRINKLKQKVVKSIRLVLMILDI